LHRKIIQLAKHSAVYGLGGVATRIIGFLLIPVYTRYLTPADYGILALCTTTVSVLKIVALGGMPSAIFRTYLLTARDDPHREKVLGTGLAYLLASGGVLAGTLLLFRVPVARLLLGSGNLSSYVTLIGLAVLAALVPSVRNADFRMRDQSTRFSLLALFLFSLNLGAALYLVVMRQQGAWGAFLASVLASGTIAVLFIPWAAARLRTGLSMAMLRDMLAFSVPLIPAGLAIWVMNLSDVYILRLLRTTEEVGLYSLGYRFGMGIYILTNAFKLAFPKVVFSEAGAEGSTALFSRIATYYVAGMGALCTAVAVLAPEIILIADARFHEAWIIIPLAVFAYFFFGLVPILEVGIDISRKVHLLAFIFVGGAVLNMGGNLIFIPRYGMMAAATTTLATYMLVALATYLVSRSLHPMRLEWGRVARVAMVLAGLGTVAVWLAPATALPAIGVKVLVLSLYPAALLAVGFLSGEERAKVRALFRRERK
jgi:O-antigen/teichoic acid export membrane protein